MLNYRIAVPILVVLLPLSLYAVGDDIKFDRISREEGLSSSIVYSIIEDEKGFLWFGTPDGLNKFDGQDFTVYKSNLNDPRSIPNSGAGNLTIDSKGLIWIGTWGGGLIRFDPQSESFTSFKNDPDNTNSISGDRVQSLYEDIEQNHWFGTYQGGLNLYNEEKNEFTSFGNVEGDDTSISHNRIWSIIDDDKNYLWVGTSTGLNRYDKKNSRFKRIDQTLDFTIRTILITGDSRLWFGTDEGLFIYDREHEVVVDTIFNDRIYALYEDSHSTIWVGTSEGLIRYDYKNNTHKRYQNIPENFFSLSVNSVRTIFEDSSGVIWIGTDGGGICRFNNNPKDFNHYYTDKSKPEYLLSNNIFAFENDDPGQIWIGSIEGLQKWDRNTNSFITIMEGEIRAFEKDPSGDLWIGSRDGLLRYDHLTEELISYNFDISEIRSIILDSSGLLWIGTYKNGVFTYDRDSDIWTSIENLNHREIWTIFEDSSGDIWIGTGDGLNRYIKSTGEYRSYNIKENDSSSLLGIRVYSIFEDTNHGLWIGTDEGLNRWYRESDSFDRLTAADGLADKSVNSILEDKYGNLWLGSNDGLTKINPETGESLTYNVEDNLQGREFNTNSALLTDDGTILMGGLDGFNSFNPLKLTESTYNPPVVLTGFSVKGENRVFSNSISYINDIHLSYRENFFTFKFKALDFTTSRINSYAYKLEGVDKDWIYINDRNHVSYTNIDGGNYIFRLKAANRDQIWNNDVLSINISVTSPPWKRWWAYLIYLTVFSAIISAVINWKVGKHKKEIAYHMEFVEKLEEKVLERTVELKIVNKKLERLSNIDDLTSLYNRRYFDKRYFSEWNRLQRVKLPISVLMCDIDNFKLYNDYYGHQAGDRCIKDVARIITDHCVRPTDLAVRYGGEEFLVILPQTDDSGAMKVAESIRASIENTKIKHEYSTSSDFITISIGVASIIPDQDISPLVLVEMADKALYVCKNNGRNKVSLYDKKLDKNKL
ncbi:MAG: diguanylate cyclase [Spirochaetaceae bacterium]|jgi:diguanylate cyclase (GGDEF)-like protein|nr:diguanylate cyclase [Spirochaetaceae bacterium]